MKAAITVAFAVGLLVLSVAGHSGSIGQQSRPLIDQLTKEFEESVRGLDLDSRRTAFGNHLTDQLILALRSAAETQLSLIQDAISAGQQVPQTVVQRIQDTMARLQSLDSSSSGNIKDMVVDLLGSLSVLSSEKKVTQVNLNQLVADFNLPNLVLKAIGQMLRNVFSPEQADYVLDLITSPHHKIVERGLADLASILSSLLALAWSLGSNTAVAVQSLVTVFFETAAAAGNMAVDEVAEQLLSYIRPFRLLLGRVYCMVVRAIQGITGTELLGENCGSSR